MDDVFKVVCEDLTNTSHAVKKDTDILRSKTEKQISQIDDNGKVLPQTMYTMLLPLLDEFKAYLGRSMDIRDRISTTLDAVAQAVAEQDKQIGKKFQVQNPQNPEQK